MFMARRKTPEVVATLIVAAAISGCLLEVPALKNARVAGAWNISIKNEKDTCMFDGWMPGSVNSLELKIDQFGDDQGDINAQLQGLLGFVFWAGVGTATLTGTISGEDLDLTLLGTKDEMLRGCTFRREIRVKVKSKADRLTNGRLTHVLRATGASTCETLNACEAIQTFDGTRIDVADASAL